MVFVGNDLYISSADNNGTIYKLDTSNPSNVPISIVSNLGTNIFGIAINNDDLFITRRLNNKIIKIDLSETNPTPVDFLINILGSTVNDMVIYQNHLYFSHNELNAGTFNGFISKVDLLQTNPVIETVASNIQGAIGLQLYQNFLLIALNSDDGGNKIATINLNDSNPVAQDLATDLDDPWNLAIQNSTLYISEQTPGIISTLNITTLSNNDFSIENLITVFPNPSSNFISISNLKKDADYTISDVTGRTVAKSTIQKTDNNINISFLSKGIYYLRLDGYSNSYKIIKN